MKKVRILLIVSAAVLVCIGAYLLLSAYMSTTLRTIKQPVRPPLTPVAVDTSYSFINYDTNHLYIAPDSTLMRKFFDKWLHIAATGQGTLNIVHIGGSHVQGGTLPHRIRCNILYYYPDLVGSRGMIFPYSAARKCNNPADYKVSRSYPLALTRNVYKEPQQKLGLCGIAVTARDSAASISIALNEDRYDFATTQVTLLGESPEGVVPFVSCGGRDLYPSRIDTIMHRYVYNLAAATDTLRILMPCDSGQSFTLRGVLLRNKQGGISYHAIGVNGAAVPDYLRCPYLVNDLRMVNPDLVIFGIGINDASGPNFDPEVFHRNYLQLVDSIRAVNPDCAFIFITNNDSFKKVKRRTYHVNNNGPKVRDICYRLADETKGAVWDQFTVMGGLKSMDQWRLAGMAQYDRVHFTKKGYEMVADLFSNALIEGLKYHSGQRAAESAAAPQPAVPPVKEQNHNSIYSDERRISTQSDDRYPYISY